MAELIGRTRSWAAWLVGAALALVFGGAGCGTGGGEAKYGPPARPPAGQPVPGKTTGSLEESTDWKTVTGAWDFCMPLATSGKSTTAQRKEADEKLKAAGEAGDRLVAAGLLAAAEAGLLAAEAEKVKADIYRNPPTDTKVLCYEAAAFAPARESSARLAARLPLLEALARDGKVHRQVLDKVAATIQGDLAVLSSETLLKQLPAEKRAEAEKTREAVKAELAKLNKLLEEKK